MRAPIAGTILKKNAEEGNIVNPVAFNGSFSLCEMADLSDLEVELTIQERDIARVFPGQACEVRGEAYADRAYAGVVSRLLPIADRAKGAVPVRVKLRVPAEEGGLYLRPEMSATVVLSETAAAGRGVGRCAGSRTLVFWTDVGQTRLMGRTRMAWFCPIAAGTRSRQLARELFPRPPVRRAPLLQTGQRTARRAQRPDARGARKASSWA